MLRFMLLASAFLRPTIVLAVEAHGGWTKMSELPKDAETATASDLGPNTKRDIHGFPGVSGYNYSNSDIKNNPPFGTDSRFTLVDSLRKHLDYRCNMSLHFGPTASTVDCQDGMQFQPVPPSNGRDRWNFNPSRP